MCPWVAIKYWQLLTLGALVGVDLLQAMRRGRHFPQDALAMSDTLN